jgi:hypothetical protein
MPILGKFPPLDGAHGNKPLIGRIVFRLSGLFFRKVTKWQLKLSPGNQLKSLLAKRRKPSTQFTAKRRAIFLEELQKYGIAADAAKMAGISRVTAYKYRKRDPEFAEQWEQAMEIGDQGLLEAARQRATKKSDTLLIFLIKGRHPEYRDKLIDVGPGGSLELNINTGPPPDASKKKK